MKISANGASLDFIVTTIDDCVLYYVSNITRVVCNFTIKYFNIRNKTTISINYNAGGYL